MSAPAIVNKPSAKNGIRLCIDSRPLNIAGTHAMSIQYQLLIICLQKLAMSKCLPWLISSLLSGLSHALDEPSFLLTTFSTPVGRMKWNRMPFGISVAPEAFQRRIDESLEGLEGTKAIADYILIWGDGNTIDRGSNIQP